MGLASTRSLAGESTKIAAEGATAPETLRQKDRDRVMNFWKARLLRRPPPKG